MAEIHLVTGGAGYFGTLLVAQLQKSGFRVRIFDINEAEERPAEVEMVRGDIRDPGAVRRALEGVSVVHHNVAMVPLAKDKNAFWTVNRDGTRNLLEAALSTRPRKIVHMSSSAVFGAPASNPVTEETPPRPQEDYGRAKLAAEDLCHEYVAKGLDVSILRPRTIMGHGRLGIMQILFEWVRRGQNVPVFGRGDNTYQFVHADDLADAAIKAAQRPGPATYNIGASEFGTMRETLEGLVAHAGTGSRVVSVPMAPAVAMMKVTSRLGVSPLGAYHALMYGRSMYFDIARARKELDWAPRFGNVAMFRDSYEWYLDHREEVLGRHGASHHRSPVRQGVLRAVGWAISLRH
ncbi:MAG TPA: NAD-dependent epimerase/dehydratase family protein [Polyangiaceae bacterium]